MTRVITRVKVTSTVIFSADEFDPMTVSLDGLSVLYGPLHGKTSNLHR